MADDPFLTKLRGAAPAPADEVTADDPFLAKVREPAADPFLDKVRAAPAEDLPAARSRLAAMPFIDLPPDERAVTSSAGTDVQRVRVPNEGQPAVAPGVTNSRMGEVGSRMAHGFADPIIESNKATQADLDQEVRNAETRNAPPPTTPQVSAGPAHGAAWRQYERMKGLGKGLLGAGAAIFTPAQMGLENADSDPMPFLHEGAGKVAENIVPRSMPGSIVDQVIPEALRKEAVGATQFAVENAPLALAAHAVFGKPKLAPGEIPFAKERIGGAEAPSPTLERLADLRDRVEPSEGTTAQPRVQMPEPGKQSAAVAPAPPVAEPTAPAVEPAKVAAVPNAAPSVAPPPADPFLTKIRETAAEPVNPPSTDPSPVRQPAVNPPSTTTEHPQAAMLRTEAENYKTDDFFGKAAHDGFLRVAAGEPVEKVAADIRAGNTEPSGYAEFLDEPGRTMGDDAAEHFESNVRVKLGEKAQEPQGPIVPRGAPPEAPAPAAAPSEPQAQSPGLLERRPEPTMQGQGLRRGRGQQGGSFSIADAWKQAEMLYDMADDGLGKLGQKVGNAVEDKVPWMRGARQRLGDKLFKSPERTISDEFGVAAEPWRTGVDARRLSAASDDAAAALQVAVRDANLDKYGRDQLARYMNSQDADVAALPDAVHAAADAAVAAQKALDEEQVKAVTLSREGEQEYPHGKLSQVAKPDSFGDVVFRAGRQTARTDAYDTAHDAYGARVRLTAEEAKGALPFAGPQPRYLRFEEGTGTTLVKWDDTPAGMAARDSFLKTIQGKFKKAKADLMENADREFVGGRRMRDAAGNLRSGPNQDIPQGKMFHEAALDTPTRKSELVHEVIDPTPPDVVADKYIDDPVARYVSTTREGASRAAASNFLERVKTGSDAEHGPWWVERTGEKGEVPPPGYVEVEGSGLAPLKGGYVEKNIYEYLKGEFTPEKENFLKDVGRALMSRFKVAHTLYSPRTGFRQLPSNMEFENYAGISNWNPHYIVRKLGGLAAMKEGSPYYAELRANGFLDPAFVTEKELGLADSILRGKESAGTRVGKAMATLGASEFMPETLNSLDAKASRLFGFWDAWTKATIYKYAIEEMRLPPPEAAAYVRKWTPSPETVSDVVTGYANAVAPFGRYKAEALRIALTAAAEKPIRLVVNRFQKNIIRGVAVGLGASALSDDEDKAISNERGAGAVALGRNDKGQPLTLDYQYLSTLSDFPTLEGGGGTFPGTKRIGKEPWFLGSNSRLSQMTGYGDNPFFDFARTLVSGEDRYGRDINPMGTTSGAGKAVLMQLVQQWGPALATYQREKLVAAIKGEPVTPNQPVQTVAQAVVDVFLGFKLNALDADAEMDKLWRQFRSARQDVRSKGNEGATGDDKANRVEELLKETEKRTAPLENVKKMPFAAKETR